MLSPARRAQFGLGAAALVLVASLAVLAGRAAERQTAQGGRAPQFTLPDLDGQTVSLSSFKGRIVVLVFCSAHSPLSMEYSERLNVFARRFGSAGEVQMVAIDTTPGNTESPLLDELRVQRRVTGQPFPTLLDGYGRVAQLYSITQTPTVIVIDGAGMIRYHGQFDDNRDARQVKASYCIDVVTRLLAERGPGKVFTQASGWALGRPE